MSESAVLPDARSPGWRFTPQDALTRPRFAPAAPPAALTPLAGRVLCPVGFHRVALVNGRWESAHALLDLPAGIRVESWRGEGGARGGAPAAAAGLGDQAFACARDGVVVTVAAKVRADRPIHIVHVADAADRAQISHARVMIRLERGARAEVIEEFVSFGEAPSWKNVFARADLDEDAELVHYRVLHDAAQGRTTYALDAELGARARCESFLFQLGGAFAREDLHARLSGEGAQLGLGGLSLLRAGEVADAHAVVEHSAVGGRTRHLHKAVLDESSRFVFEGLIHVHPGAQKTDAQVYNRNLILSETARVHSDPEFRIFADDVSCRHGGAIGRLSAESLFYLRSRGVDEAEARRMLVYAFGAEMIERVGQESLREALSAALRERMPEGREARA